MTRLARGMLLAKLIEGLRKEGNWCGERHVQKAVYFLQNLMDVPLNFKFILYKHAPFSIDLRDELVALRADGLLRLETKARYSPRIAITDHCANFQQYYPRTLSRHEPAINFISEQIGRKGVAELERLATALYVTRRSDPQSSIESRATEMVDLKPHIPKPKARDAVAAVDRLIEVKSGAP